MLDLVYSGKKYIPIDGTTTEREDRLKTMFKIIFKFPVLYIKELN
jgi:hypothetical protein